MESLPNTPVAAGDVIAGKYRVDRVLGVGGMGVVVAATHLQLEQRVALKFLLPEVAAHPEIVQRFVREARASVKIHSEHVARVLDVGTLETGTPYMVMEFLEGEDLAQALARSGALGVQDAVGYLLEACEAVAEAHAVGIVHRDLKPANLFLARRPSGRPTIKVLDFGISKVPASERDHVVTKAATLMGSPGYMSPEQMVSAGSVDARSDIWSLGVVLYELLGTRLPFIADTMPELVAAILQKQPEALGNLRPDVPIGLQGVVDTCLQKEPARRYANVAQLARALAPFGPARAEVSLERIETVLGVSGGAMQPSPSNPPGPHVASPATFSPTTSTTGRSSGRVVVPVVLGVLLLAGGGVFVALHGAGARPAPASLGAPSATETAVAASATASAPAPSASAVASAVTLAPTAPASTTASPAHAVVPAGPSHPPPAHTATAATATATAAPAPTCHVVSYFDADGNKHFKQECP